jgi:hypothetical protein
MTGKPATLKLSASLCFQAFLPHEERAQFAENICVCSMLRQGKTMEAFDK